MDILPSYLGHKLLERVAPSNDFLCLADPQFIADPLDRDQTAGEIARQR
jgi:hypothetical protein